MINYKVPTVCEIKSLLKEKGSLFNVVSLFAGGGGSSCGYRMARGKVLAVNEFVPEARKTYHLNWPDTYIFSQDVRELSGKDILSKINIKEGELDILDGSPPCSAFSSSGKKDKLWGKTKKYSDVSQNGVENLFFEYARILNEIKPKCFVAENVAGLARGVSYGFLNEFFNEFQKNGYVVKAKLLNAKWLGVPQSRERLIFVGVRKDLWKSEFEDKTHPKPFDYVVPLRDAFRDLKNTNNELKSVDISRYSIYKKLVSLKPGDSHTKHFNLKKTSPNLPSPTITATSGCLGAAAPRHWENRAFTISELKRITSIPDDYIFTGTYQQQAERMGRMVPPLMMKAIAENIYINILSKL